MCVNQLELIIAELEGFNVQETILLKSVCAYCALFEPVFCYLYAIDLDNLNNS